MSSEELTQTAERTGDRLVPPAKTLGRYQVLSLLGSGGMGQVYAAYDPKLDRRVALKLLHSDGSSAEQARLVGEAKALARLAHPNVVAVYEVDVDDGRVLVAMEYIRGKTLKAWNVEHRSDHRDQRVAQGLEIMIQAGRGLAAAHAAGLVHRDIKPANIIIGEDGRVRVVDFGLALAVEARTQETIDSNLVSGSLPGSDSNRVTATGAVVGTPAYMSPEQACGLPLSEKTDQYSFCVTAWETLVGERPEFAGLSEELELVSSPSHPTPKMTRLPEALKSTLSKGLCARERARHRSMNELLDELVQSATSLRGDSTRTKYHWRWFVPAAVLLAVGVTAATRLNDARVVTACQTRGTEIESTWNESRRAAVRDGLMATEVSYAASVAEKVMPWLDGQARAWQEQATEACLTANVRKHWDAARLDKANWCLDDRRADLATVIEGLTHADRRTVSRAITAAADLPPVEQCLDATALAASAPPPPLATRADIRQARREVSRLGYLRQTGRHQEALDGFNRLAPTLEALNWRPLTAAANALHASILAQTGDFAQAQATAEAAYLDSARAGRWNTAAGAAIQLVGIVSERGRYGEGKVWSTQASLAISLTGDSLRLAEAALAAALGSVLEATGEYDAARQELERAAEITEQVWGVNHPQVAANLNGLGRVYAATQDYAQARRYFAQASDILKTTLGEDHPDFARSLDNLAGTAVLLGDYHHAQQLGERALGIMQTALGPNHPTVASSLANLGGGAARRGDHHTAVSYYQRALPIYEAALGDEHPLVASCLRNLGIEQHRLGRLSEAQVALERALELNKRILGPEHPNVADTLLSLGTLHESLGHPGRSLAASTQALTILEKVHGPTHVALAGPLANMARHHKLHGALDKARPLYARAIEINRNSGRASHRSAAVHLLGFGELLYALGEHRDAIENLTQAADIFSAHDYDPKLLGETQFLLARALWEAPPAGGRDRDRARLAGSQALDAYTKAGSEAIASKKEVQAWLQNRAT